MRDEDLPKSELIDDAIRQAERQLEAKLEALRASALADVDSTPADDTVAVLRPTSGAKPANEDPDWTAPAATSEPAPVDVPDSVPTAWQETDGPDLMFEPAAHPTQSEALEFGEPLAFAEPDVEAEADAVADAQHIGDAQQPEDGPHDHAVDADSLQADAPDADAVAHADAADDDLDGWRPATFHEPVLEFPSTDLSAEDVRREVAPSVHAPMPTSVTVVPSDEELQFWTHTRTALRSLQQSTDELSARVAQTVADEVDRTVRDRAAVTDASVRAVQQQLQSQAASLPRIADRIDGTVASNAHTTNAAIREARDHIAAQVDRAARETRETVREDLRADFESTSSALHGAVQRDVASLEQSVAGNVNRMSNGLTDAMRTVAREVVDAKTAAERAEESVDAGVTRLDEQIRSTSKWVSESMQASLAEPSDGVRRLEVELPERFEQVERAVAEEIRGTREDLAGLLDSLIESNRTALDRVSTLTTTLDEDREQRTEDVATIVDTVTTGWEGLAAAIKVLYEQTDEQSKRIGAIEQRLGQLRDLEGSVEATMTELRSHIQELQPAPVVVTVSHADAEVRNETRAGWTPDESDATKSDD